MKKEVMISEVLAKLDDLGVSYNIGKDTDVSISFQSGMTQFYRVRT